VSSTPIDNVAAVEGVPLWLMQYLVTLAELEDVLDIGM
jgi:hypothetical protein